MEKIWEKAGYNDGNVPTQYSRGQRKVYVLFLFYSTKCPVPYFCFYVEIIADSAINGFERDE